MARADGSRRQVLRGALILAVCACTALAAGPRPEGEPPCHTPAELPPIDNREGWMILYEEAPVHPMELVDGGRELWVANIPGASVAVFDASDPFRLRLVAEIPVGLGPVTVRLRPPSPGGGAGGREIWVVCQSSNSLFILDARTRRVMDTVRLPGEPSGLVFDAAGEVAWVTLSATAEIARVEAASRRVLPPLAFAAPFPSPDGKAVPVRGHEPRALLLDGDDLYVASSKSGNGTTIDSQDRDGDGVQFEILDAWGEPGPPPPDRDVLRFDASRPDAPGTAALWRMGTLNHDLVRGPDGALWVSNVDLLNAHVSGKFAHPLNGGFAVHRVSRALPSADGSPQGGTVHVDLNAARDPRLPAGTCAMPNAMARSADGALLYVACYETRNTVVVDTRTRRVVAELRADPASPAGWGPRGLALDEEAGALYAYNRGDNTVSAFRVPAAPGSAVLPAGPAVPAGFDPTPALVKAGRRHMIDARNSATGTLSCNTCHNDGQTDGLAWDQRDFTGDLPHAPESREVDNVIKVTMDLRGIEVTPPYHWRGDRQDLDDFNPAFESLFGGRRLSLAEYREMEAFVFSLAYPPNPYQDERRVYSPRALQGFGCFTGQEAAHSVSRDTTGFPSNGANPAGRITVTCRDCHGMTAGLATGNQIINEVRFPVPQDTTQLRGLFDKVRDTAFYAGAVRPATGWGFGNNGFFGTTIEFMGMFPELDRPQKELLDAFLTELDTGIAPAAAFAWTLRPDGGEGPVERYLILQAEAGHIDLVARGWMKVRGRERAVGMTYDPARKVFVTDTTGVGPFPYESLAAAVGKEGGVLTFLGVPVGSGARLGIDRDMDFLPDGDEAALGTSTASADTDGDGFPDGYEVRHGASPAQAASRPRRETTAPAIRGARVVWVNSTVAKVRWETDEETVARISVLPAGGGEPVWTGEDPQPLRRHVRIVRGLKPGRAYEVRIEAADLAVPPNRSEVRLAGDRGLRLDPPLFPSVHVAGSWLSAEAVDAATGRVELRVDFAVEDDAGRPVESAVVHFKLVEWVPGSRANKIQRFAAPPTRGGRTSMVVPSLLRAGSGGIAEALVDREFGKGVVDPAKRLYFHPFDRETRYWARLRLP
ncbi:MAG TPA: hypothetical protein VE685_16980 [Thermoanaerobaculia bacterium]|nr:hypothetical protein [Thermoanaerobaculia bacterium]